MHEAFFDERTLIPPQNYHEIRYEDLEQSPLEQLQTLYEKFELPDYSAVAPKFAEYLGQQRTYQKNRHRELEPALRERLLVEWRRVFEEWGYDGEIRHVQAIPSPAVQTREQSSPASSLEPESTSVPLASSGQR